MNRNTVIAMVLALVTLAVYWPVSRHSFINLDDNIYVTENLQVQKGLTREGVRWAFTTTEGGNWHPLIWLSHMLDCQLFGLNAGGHHMVSVALHIASTLLLFAALKRMTAALWQSAFVAALFALHPLHVESVAWVAERKDTLSTLFWMLTMWAYARYVERPFLSTYLVVVLFFVLGLMSKPMLVTLPFVLLLLDVWPLGRLRLEWGRDAMWQLIGLVREKLPLFVLSAAGCIIAYWAQQSQGAVMSVASIGFAARVTTALVSYIRYVVKMIWPADLAIFYPYDSPEWTLADAVGSGLLLAFVFLWVIRAVSRRPYLAVGWLWYVGTLVPVIGLVQVGGHSIADRYTYIPLVGLFVMIAWGAADWFHEERVPKVVLPALAAMVLAACFWATRLQLGHWRDSVSVFSRALEVTENNHLAHKNLGTELMRQGKLPEAIEHLTEAMRLNTEYVISGINLGGLLATQGKLDEALICLTEAVRLKPDDADGQNNLGNVLASQGKLAQAIPHLEKALRLRPNYPQAHNNLGIALGSLGRHDEAIAHFAEAVRLKPDYAEAHYNLGVALAHQGKLDEARKRFDTAHELDPNFQLPPLEDLHQPNSTGSTE